MRTLKLKRGEERRIRRGHLWVYSNEVAESLPEFEPGEDVTVVDHQGNAVGSGTVNPHSLIAVRMHSRKGGVPLDGELLSKRLDGAIRLRAQLGFTDVCRVFHAEGDGLPGLIVDRFGDVLIVQHTGIGIETRRDLVRATLQEKFSPRAIVEADDAPSREHEGLPKRREVIGEIEDEVVWVEHNGVQLPVDLAHGQKTGGYLDQLANQRLVAQMAAGKTLLDLFSYTGGFALQAAQLGASSVTLVDRSESALALARQSFEQSGQTAPACHTMDLLHMADAPLPFEEQLPFDIVVCDPPPLVRNKKHIAEGMKAYEKLFARAMQWTTPGGILALFSCSHAVREKEFTEILRRSERRAGRTTRRLQSLSAGMDHPVAIGHPETEYLRGALLVIE